MQGKTVVMLGAGGAGRGLVFGAAAKGAKVIVANRNLERAQELASCIGNEVEAVALDDIGVLLGACASNLHGLLVKLELVQPAHSQQ